MFPHLASSELFCLTLAEDEVPVEQIRLHPSYRESTTKQSEICESELAVEQKRVGSLS